MNPLICCLKKFVSSDESILMSPELIAIPEPPVKWALTSLALGPVYVNVPVVALYANDPSPPASVPDM